jgi:hypothetical protein
MVKRFKVIYKTVKRHRSVMIDAFSKYDAKQRFYRTYPQYEIVIVEEL